MAGTDNNCVIPKDVGTLPQTQSYKFGTENTKHLFKMSLQSAKFRVKTATQIKKEKSATTEHEASDGILNQIGQAIVSKTKAIRRLIPNKDNLTTTATGSNISNKTYPKTPRSKNNESQILSGVKRPFDLIEEIKENQINAENCVAPTPEKKTKQEKVSVKNPKSKRSLSYGNLYSDFFKSDDKASPNDIDNDTPNNMNVDGNEEGFQVALSKNNKRKQTSEKKNQNKKQKDIDSKTPPAKTIKSASSVEQSTAPSKTTAGERPRKHDDPCQEHKNAEQRRRISQGLQIVITSEGDNSLTAIGYAKGKPLEFRKIVCKALCADVNQIVNETPVKAEGKLLMTLNGDTKHIAAILEVNPLKIKIQTNVTLTISLKAFSYIIKGVDTSSDLDELKNSIDKLNNITMLHVKFLGKPANIQNKKRAALYFETETKILAEKIVYNSCAYKGDWGRKRHADLHIYDRTRHSTQNKQKDQQKESIICTTTIAEQTQPLSPNTIQQTKQDHSKYAPDQIMATLPTSIPATQRSERRPQLQTAAKTSQVHSVQQPARDSNTTTKTKNNSPIQGEPRPTHYKGRTSKQPLLPTPVFNPPWANKPIQDGQPRYLHKQTVRNVKQPLLPTPVSHPSGNNNDALIRHLLGRLEQQHYQIVNLQQQVNRLLFHLERRGHLRSSHNTRYLKR